MQSIAETCVRFDAAHLSINLVSEIAVPMFPTLKLPAFLKATTSAKDFTMECSQGWVGLSNFMHVLVGKLHDYSIWST